MSDQPKPEDGRNCQRSSESLSDYAKRIRGGYQPNPTTGHQTQILEENSQVAKTLQEWTPALLSREAEREKWTKRHPQGVSSAALIESNELVLQLREQLATAVEALKVIEIGHGVDARIARAARAKIGGK